MLSWFMACRAISRPKARRLIFSIHGIPLRPSVMIQSILFQTTRGGHIQARFKTLLPTLVCWDWITMETGESCICQERHHPRQVSSLQEQQVYMRLNRHVCLLNRKDGRCLRRHSECAGVSSAENW